jgi:hypothetical protein
MTKITQAPFITAGPGTGFVVTDSLAVSRVRYTDLLTALSTDLQGVQGVQGSNTGVQGVIGVQGIQGFRGTQGTTGRAIQGSQGISGSAVAQGAQGRQGVQSAQGAQGQAIQGAQGLAIQGRDGTAVAQGTNGAQGVTGPATISEDTQIIYNDSGTVRGDAAFTWNKTSKTLTLGLGSTNGTTLIKGSYSNGTLTVFGTEYSSGGPMLGYAVTPSTAATDAFLSATNSGPLPRGAYIISGMTHKWYSTSSQTVASGNVITLKNMMSLDNTGLTINGNLTISGTFANAIPSGGIIMWSGGSVPSGWVLCNGDNSTPDLRNRFIVGAGSGYTGGDTGGTKDAVVVSHTHGITESAHKHLTGVGGESGLNNAYGDNGSQGSGWRIANSNASSGLDTYTSAVSTGITINTTGEAGTNKNLPPYYALAFIMKT